MSLINTPTLALLWQDAQIHPEWATTRLWEYLFNHVFFTDERYIVSSQQPPTHDPDDRRRVDLVVEKVNRAGTAVETVLFVEAKKADSSTNDIINVEHQVYDAGCAYYFSTRWKAEEASRANPGSKVDIAERVWVMTCIGSAARLWIYSEQDGHLVPFVPPFGGLGEPEKTQYLEISTDGDELLKGLECIKRHPKPPKDYLVRTPSPPRPGAPLSDSSQSSDISMPDALHQRGSPVPPRGVPTDMGDAAASWQTAAPNEPTSGPLGQAPNPGEHARQYGSGEDAGMWDARGEQEDAGYFDPEVGQAADPSSNQGWGGAESRQEVEVKVTRISHTFRKDELRFERNGRIQSSTEDDWVKGKRGDRTVWVYRHEKKTVYWTKRLG